MLIRNVFVASLLGIFGYTSAACGNSCANVDVIGTFDESGLGESEYRIYATGTFRIEGEGDERQQPLFNLSNINCEKQLDDAGKASLECKVTKAVVWPAPDAAQSQNCSLDLDFATYSMKELQKGVLTGMESSTGCFNTILTIDRNTKRVYLSFTRTEYADKYDKIMSGICGIPSRTQVLN